jgi:hypothetical protein
VGEVEAEQEEAVRRVASGAPLLGIVGDARSRTREKPFATAEEPNRSGTPPLTPTPRRHPRQVCDDYTAAPL